MGAEFFHIDRGGDVTFHGPGQLVGYPLIDLEQIGIGVRGYIDALEESIIYTLSHYGIQAGRIDGASGVWIGVESRTVRKICAIGVRASRYITMHGLAFNISTDLSWFERINPCGFTDRGVTSLTSELIKYRGAEAPDADALMSEVKALLIEHLSKILNVKIYTK